MRPSPEVRDEARRLPRIHPLRAADAFQFAAARLWAGSPGDGAVVTFDARLSLAARMEGFSVLPTGTG